MISVCCEKPIEFRTDNKTGQPGYYCTFCKCRTIFKTESESTKNWKFDPETKYIEDGYVYKLK